MKNRLSAPLACIVAAALAASALHAERYAGEFLNIPVGARAYGMGGAFGAVADDASAIYWNPAGLARLAGPEVMVTHTELFGNLANHDFIGVGWPLRPVTVGAAWIRLGVDDIPRFSHTVGTPPEGSFGDNENAFLMSAARRWGFRAFHHSAASVLCGGSVKLIYNKLDDKQATGTGLDIGCLLIVPVGEARERAAGPAGGAARWGTASLSLTAGDLGGTAISWNTVREHQDIRPAVYGVGAAYSIALPPLRSTAAVSYQTATDELQRNRFGAELSFRGVISLRAGSDGRGSTVGAGLAYWRLRLDYGFNRHDLGNSHRVGASFRL